ncbi:MAG: hypothetical protein HP491_18150 [Nitrospira sp.]|nr:hypothetical protein [Nitrospira sp.]MBH0183393.1 hypothetical protein [Nitrospira sp.]MBH0186769.1 hypothetical protein [Nitrospira sp.]
MKFVSVRTIAPVLWGCAVLMIAAGCVDSPVWAQSVSGVRGFNGGVAPLVRFPGGSLYIDNQGTQGFLYAPVQGFQTFNFRNPTTGQAWSGAVGTMGPQLSIGLIQGGNQSGNPLVLPGPPRQTAPLLPIQSTIDGFDDIP